MFKFSEKQGRLILQIECYLNNDKTNKELETIFHETVISIKHPKITDIEIYAINEKGNCC